VADRIPGPNLRRLGVGLHVEGEPFRLATSGYHLVHCRHRRSCAVIALLAGYVQKARSLEKVTRRVEAVTVD
jgi:hypothetical protein